MSAEDAFSTLKNYFETRPSIGQALSYLRKGAEIGISIGGFVECALFQEDGKTVVERRAAKDPDLILQIRPESVYVLNNQPGDELGDMLIAMIKEILAGNISLRVPGNIMDLMRNGYMDIIRAGGNRVNQFMATQGAPAVSKIMSLITNLKR